MGGKRNVNIKAIPINAAINRLASFIAGERG